MHAHAGAFTHYMNPKYDNLVNAVRDATNTGIKEVCVCVCVCVCARACVCVMYIHIHLIYVFMHYIRYILMHICT